METTTFRKVLCANRGEIAIRVFRACTELAIRTVAIYSNEDRTHQHRYKADEAYLVGRGKAPVEAYLAIDEILEIARRAHVDAIHPGYGFLAENAEFAEACAGAGIRFIGPRPEVIRALGDKVKARAIAEKSDVPVVPGLTFDLGTDDVIEDAAGFAELEAFCQQHAPVIVKAAHGGGGRGMRVVRSVGGLRDAIEQARSEAKAAFGDGTVFLEKYLQKVRHIEVQILGDLRGKLVHLYERDCSVQRRHQKIIEVAPAPMLSEVVRQRLHEDALSIGRAVGYHNAGTVEFLVAGTDSYFIEVNPRLQVEHTVTEEVTGVDLVQAQIRIAEGHSLGSEAIGLFGQNDIQPRGFAIQCRITTEDPANGFMPDTGRLAAFRSAAGFGIRLDTGNGYAGAHISPHYDSLLVKVTAHALTFDRAITKGLRALHEFRIRGVKTNIPFLENVLRHDAFRSGETYTSFIDDSRELFDLDWRRDRATKLLSYLADVMVNGHPTVAPAQRLLPTSLVEAPIPVLPDGPTPNGTVQDPRTRGAARTCQVGPWAGRPAAHRHHDARRTPESAGHPGADVRPTAASPRQPHAWRRSCSAWRPGAARHSTSRTASSTRTRGTGYASSSARSPTSCSRCCCAAPMPSATRATLTTSSRRSSRRPRSPGSTCSGCSTASTTSPTCEVAVDRILKTPKVAEVCICYTGDLANPQRTKYTLDYYTDLAKRIEDMGAHILCIKDMAGLLRPRAAEMLIGALKDATGLPIHLHTHDTSGNGVATLLRAIEHGVDIVDVALAPMAGMTSQPSMNALVAALRGGNRETGMGNKALQPLADYWEVVRDYYAPFECGLKSGTSEVYYHEIPGGQYSNLRPQVASMGLLPRWHEIKHAFAVVNQLVGDIPKVTPSSKMVGDFSIFLVQNDLLVFDLDFDKMVETTRQRVIEQAARLDFPVSVVTYFQGYIGHPPGGFPRELRDVVLKGLPVVDGRPSDNMEPVDLAALARDLELRFGRPIPEHLAVSAALYPRVMDDHLEFTNRHEDVSVLNTPTYFYGLEPGQEINVDLEPGKTLVISLAAIGDPNDAGQRTVYFDLNGQGRQVSVRDHALAAPQLARRRVDRSDPDQVGAPMPGTVVTLHVKVGDAIDEGAPLLTLEAMKMETVVRAPRTGSIAEVIPDLKAAVQVDDLLVVLG